MIVAKGADLAQWWLTRRTITVDGMPRRLRIVRFANGSWLASVDTVDGPTLGANRSPYLAIHAALEPVGVSLADAVALVGGDPGLA